MNVIFKSAGISVVAALAIGWSLMKSEENFEKMTAHYNLNQPQIEFTRSCISSLSRHNKEFKGGAASYVGCGCMASKLAEDTVGGAPVDYEKMANAFGSIAKFSETDHGKTTDIAGMLSDMTEKQGLSYSDALLAASALGQATDLCKSARLPSQTTASRHVPAPQAVEGFDPAARISKLGKTAKAPYQPTAIDAPTNKNGCEGLSASSIETLQKIADRDGKTLEEICANVVS
ncbi:MAG: hypothetical protein AAGB16_00545 [Pseudomonadota bacterium]